MPAGLIVKAGRLNKSRRNCFIVLVRRQTPGDAHGQWQPISRCGYTVVCPSYLEACNLVWWAGPMMDIGPRYVADDDAYLAYLLEHWFRISPHEAGPMDERGIGVRGNLEMMFSMFMRGWEPGAEDVLQAAPTVEMIQRLLTAKHEGR